MKRYKLLKDSPFAKAGEIFEVKTEIQDGAVQAVFTSERYKNTKIWTNGMDPNDFDEWFEEVRTFGQYYYVTDAGSIGYIKEGSEEPNNTLWRMEIGNIFETKEEAERHIKYLRAKAIIKQDTKGFKPNWYDTKQIKYSCSYQEDRFTGYGCVKPVIDSTKTTMSSLMYFKSKEDIEESLKKHPKEWKTYLFYEQ